MHSGENMGQWKKYLLVAVVTSVATLTVAALSVVWVLGLDVHKALNVARLIGVIRFIETSYVNEVDYDAMIDGGIEGMVGSLGDPHSMYLDEEKFMKLRAHTEGNFGGVGIVMSFQEDGKVSVSSVLENAPAKEAGIQEGDEIVAIDGVAVSEYKPDEVAMHIRGKEGTAVVLTVRRGDANADYSIMRSNIPFKTVAGDIFPNESGIGYIRIASFGENTAKEFKDTYNILGERGMKGLIIDLRADPGGLVDSCVDIANMIVPKGEIVSVIDRDGNKEIYTSQLEAVKYPMVVLIDENSASASEILAGALQDRQAATIVGVKSYGKGSVQMVMPMLENSAMKLTIAKYYIPSGRSIDGVGITPDVEVQADWSQGVDVQLAKAVEVLKQKTGA